jgi:S-layer homology domain
VNRPQLPALVVLATLCLPAWAAPAIRFKDVPTKYWAASAIANATQKGVMRPTAKDRFQPEKPVTRAELATILVRAIDYLESQGPVKIGSSSAKPEVPPNQLALLAKFAKSEPSYPTLERLITGGYLVPDARGRAFLPTPETLNKPATATEVAAAVAGMMIRITEKRNALEHPETLQEGDRPETRQPDGK